MSQTSKLHIPAPSGEKEALKVNFFSRLREANAQLTPLFPYLDAGAIVPTVAIFLGEGESYGYFWHENAVDEVSLCFGSNNPMLRVGQVTVGAREHGVGGPEPDHQGAYLAMTITQRQLEEGDQRESISFLCQNCQSVLFRHEFGGGEDGTQEINALSPLPTISGTEEAAALYNASPEHRECPQCGTQNDQFPKALWGWRTYVRNTEVLQSSRAAILEME